jgi:hypothetical protein
MAVKLGKMDFSYVDDTTYTDGWFWMRLANRTAAAGGLDVHQAGKFQNFHQYSQ